MCSNTWEDYAEQISIYHSVISGHQYLDCFSNDDTHIMISADEYSDNWVGWDEVG